jgi:hypothetical protein
MDQATERTPTGRVAVDVAVAGPPVDPITAPGGTDSGWFDWVMAGAGAALVAGGTIDGWAHRHDVGVETFFTPWHAVLYGALALNAMLLELRWLTGFRFGSGVRKALPRGYGLSLVGVLLFAVGGALDMLWHLVFGIEADVAALMSPTHLLLMFAGALIVTGPLRAAWWRPTRLASWPAVLSATMLLASLMFWGQFDLPVIDWWATPSGSWLPAFVAQELGVLGVLLCTLLTVGVMLPLVLRFRLPVGSVTVLVGATAVLTSAMKDLDPVVSMFVASGVVGDVLLRWLRPGRDRAAAFRAFAVSVPLATYALYFGYLLATDDIVWPVHVWLGSIVLAAIVGLLVSLLVLPPPDPTRALANRALADRALADPVAPG